MLTAGLGQNPARQAAVKAGIPVAVSAMTINKVCGSGQKAIHLGTQAILCGDAEIVVAGGQESMSRAAHVLPLREGIKLGDVVARDTVMSDGLVDAFNAVPMGATAERIATKYQVGRTEQDAFAAASQQKAEAAIAAGRFRNEIVPVEVTERRKTRIVDTDEHPTPGTTIETLAGLRPAFAKDRTVTAGNASGINDGAAAMILASAKAVRDHNLTPLARIASYASSGVEPMEMGPIGASRRALAKAGWTSSDLDLIELNEAFAAQSLAVTRDMGWNPAIINVNGGAIALGHPIGASGCRVGVTLLHEMRRRNRKACHRRAASSNVIREDRRRRSDFAARLNARGSSPRTIISRSERASSLATVRPMSGYPPSPISCRLPSLPVTRRIQDRAPVVLTWRQSPVTPPTANSQGSLNLLTARAESSEARLGTK